MKLTYYGHACFEVEVSGKRILFDPFITPNPLAQHIDVNTVQPDYILLSHAHADHIADCETIAKRSGAKVVAAWEIHDWLNRRGVTNTHPMNTGGKKDFGVFTVKCVAAHHSSSLPDGAYGGNPMGFLVYTSEGTFYYSGDTALMTDMQLIREWAPDLKFAVLPIGDNFTMDAADAARCAVMIKCSQVIGVHYDTFGFIQIDKDRARQIFSSSGIHLHLPSIGETMTL
jgi:L-ascorbate metabolism protein UlaG (beta-lactamase superfamily)